MAQRRYESFCAVVKPRIDKRGNFEVFIKTFPQKISNFVKNIKQNIITHGNKQNIHDD